jgi:signal transduction histidine kinase
MHRIGRHVRRLPPGDLALAGALALFGALDVLLSPDWRGPEAVNVVVVPAMTLMLIWRRNRPLVALAGVMGGFVFLALAFGSSETYSSLFIGAVAVYSVAAQGSNLPLAVTIIAGSITVQTLNDPQIESFGDAIWGPTFVALIFLAGLAGRAVHVQRGEVEKRARAVERGETELAAAAVADERRRIARELHDILSHNLSVLVLQAGAAEQVLERDPERAREALRWIRETGQEAIGEMSTLLGLVRGEPEASREPQPSLADLDRLISRTRDAGLAVDLQVEGDRRNLPTALELSVFRVVQEGLTNALKHAHPSEARVRLCYGKDELEVEIFNDGLVPANGHGSRRGLAGLRERVSIFGGELEAGPDPSGGWKLRAVFPVAR